MVSSYEGKIDSPGLSAYLLLERLGYHRKRKSSAFTRPGQPEIAPLLSILSCESGPHHSQHIMASHSPGNTSFPRLTTRCPFLRGVPFFNPGKISPSHGAICPLLPPSLGPLALIIYLRKQERTSEIKMAIPTTTGQKLLRGNDTGAFEAKESNLLLTAFYQGVK